jgi:hypothetical protein
MTKAFEKYKKLTHEFSERREHDVLFFGDEKNRILNELDDLYEEMSAKEVALLDKTEWDGDIKNLKEIEK